jgi:hypothetical protein
VYMGTNYLILKIIIIKIIFFECFKKMKKINVAIYPTNMKKSCSNTFYSRLHKNNKRVDLSLYIFISTTFIKFCHFYVAHNS